MYLEEMFFLSPPPPQTEKKNTPKRGQLFSFFEIFTAAAEFTHFFVTKKMFFVIKKWLNSAVRISKNELSPFWGILFQFGGGGGDKKKTISSMTKISVPRNVQTLREKIFSYGLIHKGQTLSRSVLVTKFLLYE